MKNIYFLLAVIIIIISSCNDDEPTEINYPNILLIIADDMGKDATNGYPEGSLKPNTPNIDHLKNTGLQFNNFWVYPTCSPTRASIITGKYGYRTGIKWASDELNPSENILPNYLNEQTNKQYATAVIGKWHLAGDNASFNPETLGLDYYAGLIRGAVQDYYRWQFTENGNTNLRNEYITESFTDLSINWINQQTKPWFLWLAYNAPHTPFHVPPAEMHSQGVLPEYDDSLDPMPYYLAAIEAMDFQIGRLMANIPTDELDNTIIIFIGDNGSPSQVAQLPYTNNTVKGSLYQGGINVPMFIKGAGVNRTGQDDHLICSTDLFSTILDLAEVSNPNVHDSKSFKALLSDNLEHRTFQYAEMDNGVADLWTIRNTSFKLIVNANGSEEMYDLSNDPYETSNLLNGTLTTVQASNKATLEAELLRIRN